MTNMETTEEITTTIAQGNVQVTYRVRPLDNDRRAVIEEAAQAFIQTLVQSSAFAGEEWTENQARPTEY
jgi:hypothetical protein